MRETPRSDAPPDNGIPEITTDWGMVAVSTAKDVFEALDTLPCIKIIAGIATTILQVAQEVHTNKEDCQRLARHGEKIVVSLARAQHDQGVDDDAELRDDLEDVTAAMQEVLRFLQADRSANAAMRVLRKDRTVSMVKDLDKRLDEAFRIFVMRSSVSLRQGQNAMAKQLDHISEAITSSRSQSPTPDPSYEHELIPEGVYQIVNVDTGCAIERGGKDDTYLVPSLECSTRRQLWSIMYSPRHEKGYWIRSLYDGQSMDLLARGALAWTGAFHFHGESWQTWEIDLKGRTAGTSTYTIKSTFKNALLDSQCDQLSYCERIHCHPPRPGAQAQEWELRLLHPRPPPRLQSSFGVQDPLFIQNKESKCFLTQQDAFRQTEHPNVSAEKEPSVRSTWHFYYGSRPEVTGSNQVFHIVSAYYGSTLDHWNQKFVHASTGVKDNNHTWWEIIPCGSASVIIKNRKSGKLLCHSGPSGNRRLQTAEATEYQNSMCQWYVTDVPMRESAPDICFVHDTHLALTDYMTPLQASSSETAVSLSTTSLLKVPSLVDAAKSPIDDSAINARQEGELDAARQRERDLIAKVVDRGLTSFVFGLGEVDAGNQEEWERVRLLSRNEEVAKVFRNMRCRT